MNTGPFDVFRYVSLASLLSEGFCVHDSPLALNSFGWINSFGVRLIGRQS